MSVPSSSKPQSADKFKVQCEQELVTSSHLPPLRVPIQTTMQTTFAL